MAATKHVNTTMGRAAVFHAWAGPWPSLPVLPPPSATGAPGSAPAPSAGPA
eukprot:CAMPEP_0185543372 /NCGR_PEP_ID=MMETSP1381-20130426/3232_1 /TAXON_ID=298111 /ORGANISM="Pavlova sp., Strain CCMP459" /LENGTH=50 /DNA_ID=CAMNT_0028155469 /DNA_START=50 /DNA_END=199 /DNA_ORIENTATION=-